MVGRTCPAGSLTIFLLVYLLLAQNLKFYPKLKGINDFQILMTAKDTSEVKIKTLSRKLRPCFQPETSSSIKLTRIVRLVNIILAINLLFLANDELNPGPGPQLQPKVNRGYVSFTLTSVVKGTRWTSFGCSATNTSHMYCQLMKAEWVNHSLMRKFEYLVLM